MTRLKSDHESPALEAVPYHQALGAVHRDRDKGVGVGVGVERGVSMEGQKQLSGVCGHRTPNIPRLSD